MMILSQHAHWWVFISWALALFIIGAWSTPRTWGAGELVTETMMNAHVRDNLNYLYGIRMTDWAAYTVTWGNTGTANVLGNGTIAGLWAAANKTIFCHIDLVFGTTTTVGDGVALFSLPATLGSGIKLMGVALIYDATPSTFYPGTVVAYDASNAYIVGNNWQFAATTPISALASGDGVTLNMTYRGA